MNKSSEDSNIGKNDASDRQDAELNEETLEQINGGEGDISPLDALLVINRLDNTSSENTRLTHKKYK